MNFIEKHKKFWTIIVIIASLALIMMSFLPYISLL